MRHLLLICLFAARLATAQTAASPLDDVLHLRDSSTVVGTIVSYVYGQSVTLLNASGELTQYHPDEIVRINYLSRPKAPRAEAPEPKEEIEVPTPKRKLRHHLSASSLFGLESGGAFGESRRTVGVGLSYGIMRPFDRLRLGLAVDFTFLNYSRQENGFAFLAVGEYVLFNLRDGRVNVYTRVAAGPGLPVGSPDARTEVTRRSASFLIHPSVGLEFRTDRTDFYNIFVDFGYRFWNADFTIRTAAEAVIARNVKYRRLALRGGFRF